MMQRNRRPASATRDWWRAGLGAALLTAVVGCKFPALPELEPDAGSDAAPTTYTLSVTVDGPGLISSQPAGISCSADTCSAAYDVDEQVVLTAMPAANAAFVGFSGACSGSAESCAVAMSADRMVTASFRSFDCEPNTVTCSQQVLNECDASGSSHPRVCSFGCHPSGSRCYDLAPSNVGMQACLDGATVEADATIPDGATMNTDSGAITLSGGGTLSIPSESIAAPAGGVPVRCFRVNDVTIGDVSVIGAAALAIAANGTVAINGHLSIDAHDFNAPGPGHLSAAASCNGGNGTSAGFANSGGGGGGGFGAAGGIGGSAGTGSSGGSAGPPNGNDELVPLRGGCSGGGPANIAIKLNAAGALQIVSRVGINFAEDAGISANGWGGNETADTLANRGGGSGGGILLEGPTVSTRSRSFLVANGGGGGGKSPGSPGMISTIGAPGGAGNASGSYGAGGQGGALLNAVYGSSGSSMGGGGGGAQGRIRVNAYNVFVPDGAAIISPIVSTGTPSRR